jgi:hypothetical protein
LLHINCISRALVHSSFSTRGAPCGFALTVSRAPSCTRASARAGPTVASHQLYLVPSRALELQHARCPLRLRFNCISRTLVHSSFSTRGATVASRQLYLAHSRALAPQHTRCSLRPRINLAHSRALELQQARCPLWLRFNCISRTLVLSSFSTHGARCGFASTISHTLVHSSFSTCGARCGFASTVSRALSCTQASARAVPSAASHQLHLAHSRALELQQALCPQWLRINLSRAPSCTRASARAMPPAASGQLYLAHSRALELQHARCPQWLRINRMSCTLVHSSFSTRGARCGFAPAVSRALPCTRASTRAVPAVASHQLCLAHPRALELQHARRPLRLRFNCISRTLVHSIFSTRGARCGFASTVSRAFSCTRASARAVPSVASHQLHLAHSRALELPRARCSPRLRFNCISRTLVHSSFSTRGALCGFASTVSRALSCT